MERKECAKPSGSDNNRGGMGQRLSLVSTNVTQVKFLVNAESDGSSAVLTFVS